MEPEPTEANPEVQAGAQVEAAVLANATAMSPSDCHARVAATPIKNTMQKRTRPRNIRQPNDGRSFKNGWAAAPGAVRIAASAAANSAKDSDPSGAVAPDGTCSDARHCLGTRVAKSRSC